MKRKILTILFVVVSLALISYVAFADVSKTDVTFETVQPATQLAGLLRDKIDAINDEIDQKSLNVGTGNIYYVDSAVGSDTYTGTKKAWATATLDAAIGLCTEDNGDVIYVMQGHNESLTAADGVDCDVSGVTIIGLGHGSLMPTFDYDAAAGVFVIGADNVTIVGLRFRTSYNAVVNAIDIEDGVDYTYIINCQFGFAETATDEFNDAINFGDASNYGLVQGCYFDAGLQAAVSAIYLDYDSIGTIIQDCTIMGDYSTANIVGDTTLSQNLIIRRNLLWNGGTNDTGTEPCIEMLTGTSAIICDNYIVCNLATKAASIVCDKALLFENYYNEDLTGTGGLIGTVSADD